MIYSSLLHDIGMAASNDDIEKIKSGKENISSDDFNAILINFNGNEKSALQEYIRKNHAKRSSNYVKQHLFNKLVIPSSGGTTFFEEVADICQAHTESYEWIRDNLKDTREKGLYSYNQKYCAALLRLGDILDIDIQRTPPVLYNMINPQGVSKKEWEQHFVIDNRNKVYKNKNTKKIILQGSCTSPSIHRKILDYIKWINEEIKDANLVTRELPERYHLHLEYPVDNQIEARGYSIPNLKLEVNYSAVSELLMGERIYGNAKAGLREVIQNSYDACKVREEIERKRFQYGDEEYIPKIKIIFDKSRNQVIVRDNGIGMGKEILEKYFLNIGVSFYKSNDFKYKGLKYNPVGNFGIGFLACFMLSKNIKIQTRNLDDSQSLLVELEKNSEYICLKTPNDFFECGTEITFDYNDFMEIFNNDIEEIYNYIVSTVITENIIFSFIDKDKQITKQFQQKFDELLEMYEYENTVNVSDYLKDIRGKILVDCNKEYTVGDFKDAILFDVSTKKVMDYSNLFFYKNGILEKASSEICEEDFITTDQTVSIAVLSVVRTEKEKELVNELLNKNDDYFFEKFISGKVLESIYVVLDKNIQSFSSSYRHNYNVELKKYLTEIGLVTDENLKLMGHNIECEYFAEHFKKDIFFNKKQMKATSKREELEYFINIGKEPGGLFLRNIALNDSDEVGKKYIRSLHYNLPTGFEMKKYIINIYNEKLIPNVSRESLSEDSMKLFKDAINQVVIYDLISKGNFDESEVNFFKDYIKTNFNVNNGLLIKKLI